MTRVVKLSRSAPREMRIRQMLTGQNREHGIAVHAISGKVIGFTRGTRSGTEVPLKALIGGEGYHYYHSHPDDSPFSDADWSLLGRSDAKSMTAVGHTKDYQLTPPADFQRSKWSVRALGDEWNKISDERWNNPAYKDLPPSAFVQRHTEDINRELARRTGVTYKVADKGVPFDKVAPSGSSVDDEPRDDHGRWTK